MIRCSTVPPDSYLHQGRCPRPINEDPETMDGSRCILHVPKVGPDWAPGLRSYNFFLRELGNLFAAPRPNFSHVDMRGTLFPNVLRLDEWKEFGHVPWVDFAGSTFGNVFSDHNREYQSCIFDGSTFGDLNMLGVRFVGPTRFYSCTFAGSASFSGSKWLDPAKWEHLQEPEFPASVFFGKSRFLRDKADFRGCHFRKTNLAGAKFPAGARFDGAFFQEFAWFDNVLFGHLDETRTAAIFRGAQFHGELSMREAVILGAMNLDGAVFKWTSDFSSSRFDQAPSLVQTGFEQDANFENCEFRKGEELTFRKLKKQMETQHNYWEATVFYGYELREQRRKQGWWKNLWTLNWLYWGISNYGRNWWQPFAWVIVLTVGCWFGYWATGGVEWAGGRVTYGWENDLADAGKGWQSAYFAIQNLKFSWLFGKDLLVASSGWVYAASALQSFISVILLAMGIIHIRRKYRIQ